MKFSFRILCGALLSAVSAICSTAVGAEARPNIIWIVGEDASPNLSCYGETTIKTPHLDAMAAAGVRFANAFVTCPVCSPSRSALVTGMFQTTLGALHHRSQSATGKGGGNTEYLASYRLPDSIPLVAELFHEAGYMTYLGTGPKSNKPGKTDYNFIWDPAAYDGADWRQCPKDQPFFAQIMLSGGKNRRAKQHATDPDQIKLPPYYPDHPVLRDDWADYLNSWVEMDQQVGQILDSLDDRGLANNTIVFFLTDHGISHMRGKQFLYDEGIRVPLIIKFPEANKAGTVRNDLVLHIDLAATSLALAGITVPAHFQGLDLLAENYQPREMIVSARDRCDETIETIRCVRTKQFKYIRNFRSYASHAQPNQYKDGKGIVKTMRQLHAKNKLNDLQSRAFNSTRPIEELYDLKNDPLETVNLAGNPQFEGTVRRLREALYDWMQRTNDLGLIPEPILEDLGRKSGNKLFVFSDKNQEGLASQLIDVIEAGERGDQDTLLESLEASSPSVRYWAATWLGNLGQTSAVPLLEQRENDPVPAVRVAVKLALCQLGHTDQYLERIADELDQSNLLVGMYAMNALEQTGELNDVVRQAAVKAAQSDYEFTRRYGARLKQKCEANH